MFSTPSATVDKIALTEPVVSNLLKAKTYLSRHPEPAPSETALLADFDTAIDQNCARHTSTGPFDNGFIHNTHEAAKRVLGI